MPTQVVISSSSGTSFQSCAKWTDDLPVCRQSGIGYSINQLYREDGCHQEKHPFEDRSFHVHVNSTYLYGVFDGHEGAQAASFALERMASEILLDQLNGKSADGEIKEVLREAFVAVERSYMDSIDSKVAERTILMGELSSEESPWFEAFQKYPHYIEKLKTLNTELACGSTAVIALVFAGRLFVANVGDSRALLCRTDSNGVLRVIELSADHSLRNEDELLRLRLLGLDIDQLKKAQRLGNQTITRCLGNYLVKGAFREMEDLASSVAEPVIALPEIHGGIPIDSTCQFLMLMSSGLYKTLEEASPSGQVTQELTRYVVKQFREQSTLTGVAQAVVDNIVRRHHDFCMSSNRGLDLGPALAGCPKGSREDITLLIRNFNYPLPNAINSSSAASGPRFNPVIGTDLLESIQSEDSYTYRTSDTTSSTTETSSGSFSSTNHLLTVPTRIPPYVDFSEYHRRVEEGRQKGTLPEGFDWW